MASLLMTFDSISPKTSACVRKYPYKIIRHNIPRMNVGEIMP